MRRLAGVERRAEGAQTLKEAETARSQIFNKFQAQQTENDNLKRSMAELEERLSDVCKAHETELADMNAANAVVKAKTASAEVALHSKDAQLDELKERLAALEEVLEKMRDVEKETANEVDALYKSMEVFVTSRTGGPCRPLPREVPPDPSPCVRNAPCSPPGPSLMPTRPPLGSAYSTRSSLPSQQTRLASLSPRTPLPAFPFVVFQQNENDNRTNESSLSDLIFSNLL
jgi:hypothetical protein